MFYSTRIEVELEYGINNIYNTLFGNYDHSNTVSFFLHFFNVQLENDIEITKTCITWGIRGYFILYYFVRKQYN